MPIGGGPIGGGPIGNALSNATSAGYYAQFMRALYPDSHNVNGQTYWALLGAIGHVLDTLDPYQINLSLEFSVTTATGAALDRNGADWGVVREAGEVDVAYRARILAALPIYEDGASDTGISNVIQPFTGTAPVLYDGSQDGFCWADSAFADDAWSDIAGLFTLWIYVQNPSAVAYSHLAMEQAIQRGLPVRSRVILWHNGTDTSRLAEASTAKVIILATGVATAE